MLKCISLEFGNNNDFGFSLEFMLPVADDERRYRFHRKRQLIASIFTLRLAERVENVSPDAIETTAPPRDSFGSPAERFHSRERREKRTRKIALIHF